MGSLRCKKPFSSSMYHNSNNNNSNKNNNKTKISNKNYEKKNYNCFTIEFLKPNFPVAVGPSAGLLTLTNDRSSIFRPLLLLHRPDASVSPSHASTMTQTGNVWRHQKTAQDRLFTGIHQTSR